MNTLRLFALIGGVFGILASCAPTPPDPVTNADGFQVTQLRSCGIERRGEFSLYREAPVINEGNGYIGFVTEEQNATGQNLQRYSLVNCAARTVVRVETMVPVSGSAGVAQTIFDRVDRLRDRSRLANETIFESEARNWGYDVQAGALPALGDDRATRVDCGCRRFYPETIRQASQADGGLAVNIVAPVR